MTHANPVVFGADDVSITDVVAIATRARGVRVSTDAEFRGRLDAARALLERVLAEDGVIYGVTTGYGDSGDVRIPPDLVDELPQHLVAYHGVGLGRFFDPEETRAILAARLASLARGHSGVRHELLGTLAALLEHDILPVIPAEGSVGASGDLTPLSYVAAVMCGEREVWRDGAAVSARPALAAAGITPLTLRPKEALALMNGTSVMTGLAALAWARAEYLSRLTTRISSTATLALGSDARHFDAALMAMKPHPGQTSVAGWLRADLGAITDAETRNSSRRQDRYSIRCSPHVIGVLVDALPWMRQQIETELNSVNDNPVIDAASGRILTGGHFYGGHIAFAMDALKVAVANLADLMDRQLALLVDPKYSSGLTANLTGAEPPRDRINHGLKALQISVSAWTAEALKLTMPASVFSRSTESHNQDKVSMGTIASRDCLRVLELTEQVAAALLVAVRQALTLRFGPALPAGPGEGLRAMMTDLTRTIPFVDEDRRLDAVLRELLLRVRRQEWSLY